MRLEDQFDRENTTGLWRRKNKKHNFEYSEGDAAEEKIFKTISDSSDKSVLSQELDSKIDDWSSFYHLSSKRANLLRPVMDCLQGPILEIGSGCGAITRFLGESGKAIVSIEGSERRAASGALRCRDLENVDVVCSTLSDFRSDKKFKSIIVVGVLEYAQMFGDDGPGTCDSFLEKAATFLDHDGKILIAIENQLGLKYFAGYNEDHAGIPFYGIEAKYSTNSFITFGRKELRQMIGRHFSHQKWFFPFPDYKVPITILSELGASSGDIFDAGTLCSQAISADLQKPTLTTFALDQAWMPVARNGLIPDLANSFLIVASKEATIQDDILAWHYSVNRIPSLCKSVTFRLVGKEIIVERDLLEHHDSAEKLTIQLHGEKYARGQHWHDELFKIVSNDGWTVSDIVAWLIPWWSAFCEERKVGASAKNDIRTMVPGDSVDLIPRNMIRTESGFEFIDQEWIVPTSIELGYVLFRALYDGLLSLDRCAEPAGGVSVIVDQLIIDVLLELGFWLSRDDVRRYKGMERQFQEWASNLPQSLEAESFGNRLINIRHSLQSLSRDLPGTRCSFGGTSAQEQREAQLNTMLTNLSERLDHDSDYIQQCKVVIRSATDRQEVIIKELALILSEFQNRSDKQKIEMMLRRLTKSLFSPEWYLNQNPDVRDAGVEPFSHFLQHGIYEGRKPNPPLFSSLDQRD